MFHPLAEKTIKHLGLSGSVCEFGNQRYGGNGSHASVKDFYLSNGFSSYVALDVNTAKDAVIADLNYPVEMGPFDLVTNNGTGEHLWNQHQVFKNAHDLCKHEGVMVHILPFTPWVNHGFFNYNPILFRDLAAANDYEILIQWIGDRTGRIVELGDWAYIDKRPTQLIDALNTFSKDVFCVFAYRKTNGMFCIPFQGKYLKDIESDDLRQKYS